MLEIVLCLLFFFLKYVIHVMCSKTIASHSLHSKIPVLGKSVSILPAIQIKTLTQWGQQYTDRNLWTTNTN